MTLSQDQLTRLSGLSIELQPVTLPAFSGSKSSYWIDYEKIEESGISEIRVSTTISGQTIGSFAYLHIDCHFADEDNVQKDHGLVYGDDTFEKAIDAYVKSILGAPDAAHVSYTEQGMQGDDLISLEGNEGLIAHVAQLSNHALFALTRDDRIKTISVDDFSWP